MASETTDGSAAADREDATDSAGLRAALSEALRRGSTPPDLVREAGGALGEHVAADCVGYSEADASGEIFTVTHEWSKLSDFSVLGRHRLEEFGPEMVAALRMGQVVAFADVAEAPETAAHLRAFQAQGFKSFVAAPILKEAALAGTFFVLSRRPRAWSAAEIALIVEVGERIWAALDAQRAVAARLESEAQLRQALKAAAAGTFHVWTQADRAPLVSEGARELFGFAPDEAPAMADFLARVHDDDRAAVLDAIERSVATRSGHDIEYRVIRPDGSAVWLVSRAEFTEAWPDGAGVLRGVIMDVTERKRGEEALRRERTLLRTIIDSIPVMLTLYDPEVNMLLLNSAFERLTGWSSDDAAAASIMEEIYPDPDYRAEVQSFMDAAEGWMDIEMRTRDGGRLESSWSNVRLADGRRIGIGLDISERKSAERQRELLIAELDHRVKNTLSLVQALAQQSFRGLPAATPAKRSFEGRLAALAAAHDLLTETAWSGARLTDLADAVLRAACARTDAVRIEGPAVLLPPKQAVTLVMALHELATNATKYGALSVDGGAVRLAWTISAAGDHCAFDLEWIERGGPPATAPERKGFGVRMIERALAAEFQGAVRADFAEAGFELRLTGRLRAAQGVSR